MARRGGENVSAFYITKSFLRKTPVLKIYCLECMSVTAI